MILDFSILCYTYCCCSLASPGERVNRPTLGCSLMQLVFSPNSEELSTAVQFLVQGSLQQWLGELIQVERVQVESEDTKLRVTVQYVI
ncbi:GPW/gp25 family protein, partial [Moorena sp. SIO3I6]